jgi:hypothetical protein
MKQIILSDRCGYDELIEEMRVKWVEDILQYIGADLEYLSSLPKDYEVKYYQDNNIEIIYYQDLKACKVIYDGELIGEWLSPSFKLKKDQDLYYEITLESWSILEESFEDEQD